MEGRSGKTSAIARHSGQRAKISTMSKDSQATRRSNLQYKQRSQKISTLSYPQFSSYEKKAKSNSLIKSALSENVFSSPLLD